MSSFRFKAETPIGIGVLHQPLFLSDLHLASLSSLAGTLHGGQRQPQVPYAVNIGAWIGRLFVRSFDRRFVLLRSARYHYIVFKVNYILEVVLWIEVVSLFEFPLCLQLAVYCRRFFLTGTVRLHGPRPRRLATGLDVVYTVDGRDLVSSMSRCFSRIFIFNSTLVVLLVL